MTFFLFAAILFLLYSRGSFQVLTDDDYPILSSGFPVCLFILVNTEAVKV